MLHFPLNLLIWLVDVFQSLLSVSIKPISVELSFEPHFHFQSRQHVGLPTKNNLLKKKDSRRCKSIYGSKGKSWKNSKLHAYLADSDFCNCVENLASNFPYFFGDFLQRKMLNSKVDITNDFDDCVEWQFLLKTSLRSIPLNLNTCVCPIRYRISRIAGLNGPSQILIFAWSGFQWADLIFPILLSYQEFKPWCGCNLAKPC